MIRFGRYISWGMGPLIKFRTAGEVMWRVTMHIYLFTLIVGSNLHDFIFLYKVEALIGYLKIIKIFFFFSSQKKNVFDYKYYNIQDN